MRHHVYLIPGFFGFANFGDFKYFAHVREHLRDWLDRRGVNAAIHYAPSFPTASLRRRAGRVMEIVAETASDDDGPIHLIGHSTGGLDARLAVAPRASLLTAVDHEPFAQRVQSVVAVTAPHYGAPTAAFFTSLLGQRLLALLSLTTVHAIRLGSIPMPALVVLAGALGSTGALRSISGGVLDQVFQQVLRDFDAERRQTLQNYFGYVIHDQTLLVQLTPEGMDLFNAMATERVGVRRGGAVRRGHRRLRGRLHGGLHHRRHLLRGWPGQPARALSRLRSERVRHRLELQRGRDLRGRRVLHHRGRVRRGRVRRRRRARLR